MLPILVSVPHGGRETPPEIADRVTLSERDLFDDGDAYTREIYSLAGDVARFERADIARAFVDLNRAADDRPPTNPDGVVKTATCFGVPIYSAPLTPELTDLLITQYHAPYHTRLEEASRDSNVRLGIDCHSMASEAPPVAPDPGAKRPLFCLSNRNGETCPPELLESLAAAIADAFEVDQNQISLNEPFQGGYIVSRHGNRPIPWIQVEMSRSLYISEPWFAEAALAVDPVRLTELRGRFLAALNGLDL